MDGLNLLMACWLGAEEIQFPLTKKNLQKRNFKKLYMAPMPLCFINLLICSLFMKLTSGLP